MADRAQGVMSGTARRAERAAPGSDWLETFARVGYFAKGIVYIVVGILAVQAARAGGGETAGPRGAIEEIATQPFGQALLILTAVGLACYAIWRLTMAALDPEREGTDAKGLVKRIGYAVSGIVNLALAYFAVRLVMGGAGGGDGGSSQQEEMTARLMSEPYGLWIVGAIGAIIVGVGLYHFYRVYTAKFMRKYDAEMSLDKQRLARRIGRLGLAARGVAFCLVGSFFIEAAISQSPDEAGGLSEAFSTLLQQPYGPWLLGVVAVGFICYGIYCFANARYRRFQTNTALS